MRLFCMRLARISLLGLMTAGCPHLPEDAFQFEMGVGVCDLECPAGLQCYESVGCQPCNPARRDKPNNGCRPGELCVPVAEPDQAEEGVGYRCVECDPEADDGRSTCEGAEVCIGRLGACGACDPDDPPSCAVDPTRPFCAVRPGGDPTDADAWSCLPCDPSNDNSCPPIDGAERRAICVTGPGGLGCHRCAPDDATDIGLNCDEDHPVCLVDQSACVACAPNEIVRDVDPGCEGQTGRPHCVAIDGALTCAACNPALDETYLSELCVREGDTYRNLACIADASQFEDPDEPPPRQCSANAPVCVADGDFNQCQPCRAGSDPAWCRPWGRQCAVDAGGTGGCNGPCFEECDDPRHVQDPDTCACKPCNDDPAHPAYAPCPDPLRCVDERCQACDPANHAGCAGGQICVQQVNGFGCADCTDKSQCAGYGDPISACIEGRCAPCDCDCRDPDGPIPRCGAAGCDCTPCLTDGECVASTGAERPFCVGETCQACLGQVGNDPRYHQGCNPLRPICECADGNCTCQPCESDDDCDINFGEVVGRCVDQDEDRGTCSPCDPDTFFGCWGRGDTPDCRRGADGGYTCQPCDDPRDCVNRGDVAGNGCREDGRCGACNDASHCLPGLVCFDGVCQP
jgi:hypothetical protein